MQRWSAWPLGLVSIAVFVVWRMHFETTATLVVALAALVAGAAAGIRRGLGPVALPPVALALVSLYAGVSIRPGNDRAFHDLFAIEILAPYVLSALYAGLLLRAWLSLERLEPDRRTYLVRSVSIAIVLALAGYELATGGDFPAVEPPMLVAFSAASCALVCLATTRVPPRAVTAHAIALGIGVISFVIAVELAATWQYVGGHHVSDHVAAMVGARADARATLLSLLVLAMPPLVLLVVHASRAHPRRVLAIGMVGATTFLACTSIRAHDELFQEQILARWLAVDVPHELVHPVRIGVGTERDAIARIARPGSALVVTQSASWFENDATPVERRVAETTEDRRWLRVLADDEVRLDRIAVLLDRDATREWNVQLVFVQPGPFAAADPFAERFPWVRAETEVRFTGSELVDRLREEILPYETTVGAAVRATLRAHGEGRAARTAPR